MDHRSEAAHRLQTEGDSPVTSFTARYLAVIMVGAILLLMTGTAIADESTEQRGTSIIGNNELPKALFITPWKEPQAPLQLDRPLNSLLKSHLEPVDPDVFRRQLRHYQQTLNSQPDVRNNNDSN